MAKIACQLENLFNNVDLPFLLCQQNNSITLSKLQIASFLANVFFFGHPDQQVYFYSDKNKNKFFRPERMNFA